MNYNLNELFDEKPQKSTYAGLKKLVQLITHEKKNLILAFLAILINSILNLLGPFLIGHTIDKYVVTKDFNGVLLFSGILLTMYLLALVTSYLQTQLMGGVGQRMLFTLRNAIFNKLQQLPLAFFNQNKAGDLISRINNDTDKLNQFFSQSLMQFIGSIFTMIGAAIFLLSINGKLGLATLTPAVIIILFTQIVSPWVKRKNAATLKSTGGMSAEIQESLTNFKVIIAFNRRDYFRKRFNEANQHNYKTAIGAGMANSIFLPIYGLFSSFAQLIVLAYGIYLIAEGQFTIGLLISYLSYATNLYNPLRQLASLWSSFQIAMASWDRVSLILSLETSLTLTENKVEKTSDSIIEFRDVSFAYPGGNNILHHINFKMIRGKTYALVGPTGGGKTTTASLMARLYDPTEGTIYFDGIDLRTYNAAERAQKIGFILQEPFLFTGTIKDNILYNNALFQDYNNDELAELIKTRGLEELLAIFDNGLETEVLSSGNSISLGQKQVIAFIRAVIRNPEVLILDEATANIDTITEKLLDKILKKLPIDTTLVIIAHRLNTIENADEIYFINSGQVTLAGSFNEALDQLMKGKRLS